jgi:hypothetical protein
MPSPGASPPARLRSPSRDAPFRFEGDTFNGSVYQSALLSNTSLPARVPIGTVMPAAE